MKIGIIHVRNLINFSQIKILKHDNDYIKHELVRGSFPNNHV